MIYHSLKKNTEPMRFDLRCEVSKYHFELIKKTSEDFDFDWGDLFDIYKTDEKEIDRNVNDLSHDMILLVEGKDKIHVKEIKFEGTIDFDLDKIEPLMKELKIFRDYFSSHWEGRIYYLGEKRKDLIGKNYWIHAHSHGLYNPMDDVDEEEMWEEIRRREQRQ